MKVAAVVVLYNPDKTILNNIKTYYAAVDKIYVIDNSENPKTEIVSILKMMSKVKYISNKGNKGIAFALNRGAKNAIYNGFQWLLTMDQDTSFSSQAIIYLLDAFNELKNKDNIAIIAANYLEPYNKNRVNIKYSDENVVIQSGSIINLKIYQKIGGYENRLFIDEVDFDYCYRCKEQDYSIIKVNRAMMQHNRGNIKKEKNLYTWNYPPIRYYYIIRNRIYVYRKHRIVIRKLNGNSKYIRLSETVRLVWKEEKRYIKLLAIFLGILDYMCNRMGKCKWKGIGG